MNTPVICAERLSKRYRITHKARGRASLRDAIAEKFHRAGTMTPDAFQSTEQFWALKDLSFEIHRGEVIGIIGRNGAGKSTLLKILSRIIDPTEGTVRIKGRVASLLEVGTGFHPELTGRENVFLNGSILGMSRREIAGKFDEIVAFADVERFLDTPVKHYSSGMYVRLAFAVAAHMDPQILLVDEVLAVGDAEFQKKSLGKMRSVTANHERTVLFVSHNIGMIGALCDRTLLLQAGKIVCFDNTASVVSRYLDSYRSSPRTQVAFKPDPSKAACVIGASLLRVPDLPGTPFSVTDRFRLRMQYQIAADTHGINVVFCLVRNGSPLLLSFDSDLAPELQQARKKGIYEAEVELPQILKAGRYSITLEIGFIGIGLIDKHEEALVFEIEEFGVDFSQKSYEVSRAGEILFPVPWKTKHIESGVLTN